MADLLIKEVNKSYQQLAVLKNISLDIKDGCFLVLVGPSGCGKSTLLNCIAGLEQITSGDIFIDKKNATYLEPQDRDIAMIFQSYALYPNMTVRQNMSFGLENKKMPKNQIKQTVENTAKILQITPLLERKPAELSGGQRQRVAMGRAISRKAGIYLFDEPLSNLDAKLRVDMRAEIKILHQKLKNTIVYVTHDQIEAMTMADSIALMKDGSIQQLGTPEQIYNQPKNIFVAKFIGSPSMNFIPCVIKENKLIKEFFVVFKNSEQQEFNLKITDQDMQESLKQYKSKEVICGLRPEYIQDALRDQQGQKIKIKIIISEATGPDLYVIGQINGVNVNARCSPNANNKGGEYIELILNMTKAVFFDPTTQNRITASSHYKCNNPSGD